MEYMGYDKKEYEDRIKASPLFTLNKDTESTAYERESKKMVGNLFCYLCAVKAVYEDFGLEIYTLAVRCIDNYDATKGEFLHYFNAAWKLEYSRIRRDQQEEETFGGIHVTEDIRRFLRQFKRLKRDSSNYGTEKFYHTMSEVMGLSEDKIRELEALDATTVCRDTYINGEGQEQSTWDTVPGKKDFVEELESYERVEGILCKIEETYDRLQERQKGIVSDVMTIEICRKFDLGEMRHPSFLNESIVQNWLKSGKLPTQREIAEKYGRNEASISRTIKKFHDKLKEVLIRSKIQE